MNDLFSGSFSRFRNEEASSPNHADIEMSSAVGGGGRTGGGGVNLDKFFMEVESVKEELREIESIQQRLQNEHKESQTLHNAESVRVLRARMDSDVSLALRKAKMIKLKLEALDRSTAANRSLPGSGPGSSADRTRTSVIGGLRNKLRQSTESFVTLRQKISYDYRDTVKRRYYTVTGENPTEETVENLISSGESENFLQKAIREQGRGNVLETINEIQERHSAAKDLEKNLYELQQLFMDMSVLVEAQGEQLNDIEHQVVRADSLVRGGTQELQTARKHQKNTRKWSLFAIILVLIIILIILLTVRPWQK